MRINLPILYAHRRQLDQPLDCDRLAIGLFVVDGHSCCQVWQHDYLPFESMIDGHLCIIGHRSARTQWIYRPNINNVRPIDWFRFVWQIWTVLDRMMDWVTGWLIVMFIDATDRMDFIRRSSCHHELWTMNLLKCRTDKQRTIDWFTACFHVVHRCHDSESVGRSWWSVVTEWTL